MSRLDANQTTIAVLTRRCAPLVLGAVLAACSQSPSSTPASAAGGSLAVGSTPPGASITLGASSTGRTTPAVLEVAAGEHALALGLDGYEPWQGKVQVETSRRAVVAATLVPLPGRLALASRPAGATIRVDDRDTLLRTPAVVEGLAAGSHLIGLELPGYETWLQRLAVEAGKTTPVEATLRARCPGALVGDLTKPPAVRIVGLQPGHSTVRGMAANIHASQVRVVLWALTNQWYVQPFIASPYTAICGDGSWSNSTHPWSRMVALLVDTSYVPGATRIHHPSLDKGVIAWDEYPPRRPDLPLQFAGHTWSIKVAESPFDPGPNYWSDSTENVWIDAQGLHLRIRSQGGRWTCSEVVLTRSLGHGIYTFQIVSPLHGLDARTVAGAFLYENPQREIDFEWAGSDLIPRPDSAQFVIQPYTRTGNLRRFVWPAVAESTHRLVWRQDRLEFLSWKGLGAYPPAAADVIQSWTYQGPDIPPAGNERFHFNVWLLGGRAPAKGDEVVIRSFHHAP